MPTESATTRDRIIEAAEDLFGQHGFPRASLRRITEKARVNLASVNYHFSSKEDLYKQIMLRHLRPINEERITLLAQAEQLAGDQPLPLRAILDTFIRPLLRRAADNILGGKPLLRLISRDLTDPQPFMREELAREFEPLIARYTQVLSQTLPGLPSPELFWRMQFTVGALLYTAAHQHEFERLSQGLCPGDDLDGCIRRLVDFCAAGFDAPPSPGGSPAI